MSTKQGTLICVTLWYLCEKHVKWSCFDKKSNKSNFGQNDWAKFWRTIESPPFNSKIIVQSKVYEICAMKDTSEAAEIFKHNKAYSM